MVIITHADIFKGELLLVHGSRSKQSGFNSLFEPGRSDVTGIADLFNTLNLVGYALTFPIAECNHTCYLLAFANFICTIYLTVRETCPAGVKSQLLLVRMKRSCEFSSNSYSNFMLQSSISSNVSRIFIKLSLMSFDSSSDSPGLVTNLNILQSPTDLEGRVVMCSYTIIKLKLELEFPLRPSTFGSYSRSVDSCVPLVASEQSPSGSCE